MGIERNSCRSSDSFFLFAVSREIWPVLVPLAFAPRNLFLAKQLLVNCEHDSCTDLDGLLGLYMHHRFWSACIDMPPAIKSSPELLGGSNHVPPDEIVFGRSTVMSIIQKRVEKIGQTNVPVLLCGDAGTGKEMVARWMHRRSPYKDGQFVKVNCAAIPGALLESELFGYEKGTFTGAQGSKPGRVELADKGTVFLDEIAELDVALQSKLLHFVQDGTFSRIGGELERFVETRVICSTNRDLEGEIEAGRFRADLYYRIGVFQIKLPKLAQRREDVPALAQYFRMLYQRQFGKECDPLGSEMLNYLENLSWPGNVRELSNCIARYVLIGQDAFPIQDFPKRRSVSEADESVWGRGLPLRSIAKEAVRELERNVILEALRAHQWNRRKAAQVLKISYRTLIYKIRNAGLMQSAGRDEPMDPAGSERVGRKSAASAD